MGPNQIPSNESIPQCLVEQYVDVVEEIRNCLTGLISKRLTELGSSDNTMDTETLAYLDGLNFVKLKNELNKVHISVVSYNIIQIMNRESRIILQKGLEISLMAISAQVDALAKLKDC